MPIRISLHGLVDDLVLCALSVPLGQFLDEAAKSLATGIRVCVFVHVDRELVAERVEGERSLSAVRERGQVRLADRVEYVPRQPREGEEASRTRV